MPTTTKLQMKHAPVKASRKKKAPAGTKGPPSSRSDLVKAIIKPKRALTAFNLFTGYERERILNGTTENGVPPSMADVQRIALQHKHKTKRVHRKTHGKYSFQELSKLIAKSWKELPRDQKQLFEAQAIVERRERDHFIEATRQRALISATFAQQQQRRANVSHGGASSASSDNTIALADNPVVVLRAVSLPDLLQLRTMIEAEIDTRRRNDLFSDQEIHSEETLRRLLSSQPDYDKNMSARNDVLALSTVASSRSDSGCDIAKPSADADTATGSTNAFVDGNLRQAVHHTDELHKTNSTDFWETFTSSSGLGEDCAEPHDSSFSSATMESCFVGDDGFGHCDLQFI